MFGIETEKDVRRLTEDFLSRAMEQYGSTVYRTALCRLQNTADAEDVYQDTFLRLCQQKTAISWDDEHLKAWLLRVAINLCNDLGRYRRRSSPLSPENLPIQWGADMDSGWEIWEAASHLPEKQRLVFNLRYYDELEYEEIARVLDSKVDTLKVNYHYAKEKIKEYILNR